MSVGFTVIRRDSDVEFQFLGRDPGAPRSLASFHRSSESAAALMGRLHYRQELLSGLGADAPGAAARQGPPNDAALALAAYRRWGRDGLARLEGDFALALWDGRRKRLLACRDPLGGYPLFWTQCGATTALSTGIRPLLALRSGRSLNLDYLADYLMTPLRSVRESPDEHTAYEGVRRLLAGNILCAAEPGGVVERRRYWDWLERQVDPGTGRLEEVAARFGELLCGAVRERLYGRTAAHVSGGMDSTSAALIARDHLAARPGAGPLHTLSLVYDRLSGLARERPFLESALGPDAGVVAHRIPADDLLDFDSFHTAPPHDEPCPWLWSQAAEQALILRAEQAEADSVLTGHGADGLLELMPYHLTEMLRGGRFLAAWREACRWAAAANCSPWKYLRPFGLDNLLPAWARAGLGPWFRGGYADGKGQNPWTIAPWVRPDFARRHGLRGRGLANLRAAYSSCRPVGLSVTLFAVTDAVNDFTRWALAAPRGIHLAHPFLDPRVVCFGLGMQTRLRREPGRQKPVLAEAMRGLLPDRIRARVGKGHFNEVYFRGLSRNLPALEALVRRSRVEELGLFDMGVLLRRLHEAALGSAAGMAGLSRLNGTLSLLKWLALEETRPSAPAAPARVVRMSDPAPSDAPPGLRWTAGGERQPAPHDGRKRIHNAY